MVREMSRKFIVQTINLDFLIKNISSMGKYDIIMSNQIMTRTIFNVSDNPDIWLRIRQGDVDCQYNSMCNVALKSKHSNDQDNVDSLANLKHSIVLNLQDYDNAVLFFKDMGFTIVSIQENRRSKFICYYDDIKYTICFDQWPHLEDLVFITLTPGPNADLNDINAFIKKIDVTKYSVEEWKSVDIDDVYNSRHGLIASQIYRLNFDYPLPKLN